MSDIIENIKKSYKGKQETDTKVKFWRAASSGELDAGKWQAMETTRTVEPWTYLFKYPMRTPEDYNNQLKLSVDPAFSRDVIDVFTNFWSSIKYEITINGLNAVEKEKYLNNIDNQDNSYRDFDNISVEELLKTGLVAETVDVDPATKLFYIAQIMREKIHNYSQVNDGFDFFVYCKDAKRSSDFLEEIRETYIAWDKKRRIVVIGEDIESNLVTKLNAVPVFWQKMGKDAKPIINTIAKIQLDLYNLQSEWRSVLSDQAGASFLTGPIGCESNIVSNKTYMGVPIGSNPITWQAYPSSGLDAHATYWETMLKVLQRHSKNGEYNARESGEARSYEFYNTKAVIKLVRNKVESLHKNRAKYLSIITGNTVTIDIVWDEPSFNVDILNQQIDNLLKIQALSIIPFELKKKFAKLYAKKELGLKDKEVEDLFAELTEENDFVGEEDPDA